MFAKDDRVNARWLGEEDDSQATVVEVLSDEAIVLVFDDDWERDEYQFEVGVDGLWYEVNNSQVGVTITKFWSANGASSWEDALN